MGILRSAFVVGLSAFVLFTASPAFAGSWETLVKKIVSQGEPMEMPDGLMLSLSRIVPDDLSQPHRADYISTVGWLNSAGEYSPYKLYSVSEDWQINAQGNWVIDQWIHELTVEGSIVRVSHNEIVETMNGTILDHKSFRTGAPDSVEEIERWNKLLAPWLKSAVF